MCITIVWILVFNESCFHFPGKNRLDSCRMTNWQELTLCKWDVSRNPRWQAEIIFNKNRSFSREESDNMLQCHDTWKTTYLGEKKHSNFSLWRIWPWTHYMTNNVIYCMQIILYSWAGIFALKHFSEPILTLVPNYSTCL